MKIRITVKPHAKEERVEQVAPAQFRVWVKEPPTEGHANDAVCRALARYFDVPPSCVTIVGGRTSKMKIVEITGM